jgi:integrase
MPLSAKRTAKLIHAGKPVRRLDKDGLYLVIAGPKNAHWEFRYQLDLKPRWMGLGSARKISLAQARVRAQIQREKLVDRIDPIQLRRSERAAARAATARALTFKEAAERYFEANQSAWSSAKHAAGVMSTLQQWAYPKLAELDVAAISKDDILAVLEQRIPGVGRFWDKRTVTADRLRNRIRLILDWAVVRGHRPASQNPAAWGGFLELVLPAPSKVARTKNHAAMPYGEVPGLMAELTQQTGVGAAALQFVILTSARLGEVLGATWSEIDLKEAVWKIPAHRMKGRREHRVPLSAAAVELLKGLRRVAGNPHVFPGVRAGKGVSAMAISEMLIRMGHTGFTLHGFRSSFRDWAAERTNYPREVCEMALAHNVKRKSESAYWRGDVIDKRRQLAEAWSRFCMSPPAEQVAEEEVAGNVVPMQGRQ